MDDNNDDDTELTALQTIMRDREAARALLNDLEGVEEQREAYHDPNDTALWEIKLELHAEDLPAMRRELREYIEQDDH